MTDVEIAAAAQGTPYPDVGADIPRAYDYVREAWGGNTYTVTASSGTGGYYYYPMTSSMTGTCTVTYRLSLATSSRSDSESEGMRKALTSKKARWRTASYG
jgi:hypothetical protein